MSNRIKELRDLIEHHNSLYWEKNNPEISDIEYDKLTQELQKLSPNDPLLEKIGRASITNGKYILNKLKLPKPLLSLDKVYSLDSLIEWVNKVKRSEDEKFIVECKYDGMTCCLFRHMAATRGDGEIGENITDKVPIIDVVRATGKTEPMETTIKSLGNKIRVGELLITNSMFSEVLSKIKRTDGTSYKNPRNAVAGIMGSNDISSFMAQGVRLTMIEYGAYKIVCTAKDIRRRWDAIADKLRGYPFPQDGIVVKLLDQAYADSLGYTAHHPKGAIAYKFTNPKETSEIIAIEWQVGKEALTPVAYIKPVTINGSTITKATLHNYKRVLSTNAAVGCKVDIERSGDVIPFISVIYSDENKHVVIPEYCPVCGHQLVVNGVDLVCPNLMCQGKAAEKIEAGLKYLGAKGIGAASIIMAIKYCQVTDIVSWFQKMTDEQTLLNIGFGNAQAKVIASETNRIINSGVPIHIALASLNIPGIGVEVAKSITSHIPNTGILLDMKADGGIEAAIKQSNLSSIKGIGDSRANTLINAFSNNADKYKAYFDLLQPMYPFDNSELQTVCFTGKMILGNSVFSRAKMFEIARNKGLEPVDSVTKNLSMLVVANKNIVSSKLDKAKQLGIPILTYEEFMNK